MFVHAFMYLWVIALVYHKLVQMDSNLECNSLIKSLQVNNGSYLLQCQIASISCSIKMVYINMNWAVFDK